jgi:hypothetical protein
VAHSGCAQQEVPNDRQSFEFSALVAALLVMGESYAAGNGATGAGGRAADRARINGPIGTGVGGAPATGTTGPGAGANGGIPSGTPANAPPASSVPPLPGGPPAPTTPNAGNNGNGTNAQPGATSPTFNTNSGIGTGYSADPSRVAPGVVAPGTIGPNGIEAPSNR